MKARVVACCIFILVSGLSASSQGQPSVGVTPGMRTEANGFYQAADWLKAAAAYEKIVSLEDTNANARYRLGNSLLNLNKVSEALPHLERGLRPHRMRSTRLRSQGHMPGLARKQKPLKRSKKAPKWAVYCLKR